MLRYIPFYISSPYIFQDSTVILKMSFKAETTHSWCDLPVTVNIESNQLCKYQM